MTCSHCDDRSDTVSVSDIAHTRLKMDGGWGSRMAKWEHFHQILSKKYSFPQKVGLEL